MQAMAAPVIRSSDNGLNEARNRRGKGKTAERNIGRSETKGLAYWPSDWTWVSGSPISVRFIPIVTPAKAGVQVCPQAHGSRLRLILPNFSLTGRQACGILSLGKPHRRRP